MKYITLLLALSAASFGAAQTWVKTMDVPATPYVGTATSTLIGSAWEMIHTHLESYTFCQGSPETEPPWTLAFKTLFEPVKPHRWNHDLYNRLPGSGYMVISYDVNWAYTDGTCSWEGWSLGSNHVARKLGWMIFELPITPDIE